MSTKQAAKQDDSATSSDEIMDSYRKSVDYDGDKRSKVLHDTALVTNESVNRIFGASKASFR